MSLNQNNPSMYAIAQHINNETIKTIRTPDMSASEKMLNEKILNEKSALSFHCIKKFF